MARRLLATLLGRDAAEDEHLVEYALILVLIVVLAALSLVFLGDAVADLVSLIGGQVDQGALQD